MYKHSASTSMVAEEQENKKPPGVHKAYAKQGENSKNRHPKVAKKVETIKLHQVQIQINLNVLNIIKIDFLLLKIKIILIIHYK